MAEPVIDRVALEAEWAAVGAPGAVKDVASAFLDDADIEIDACVRASNEGDLAEFMRLTHRLKSSSAALRALRLSRILRKAEQAAREGDLTECRGLAADLQREYPKVRAALVRLIDDASRADASDIE